MLQSLGTTALANQPLFATSLVLNNEQQAKCTSMENPLTFDPRKKPVITA